MKINTDKTSRKKVAIIVIAAVVLIGGLITVFILSRTNNLESGTSQITEAERRAQQKADNESKQAHIEQEGPGTPQQVKDDLVAKEGSIAISTEVEDNGSVTILTKLIDIPSGECSLLIKNDSQTYSDKADVIYQPEFSSCAGFSVPVTKLGRGQWVISLTVINGENKYETSTQISV